MENLELEIVDEPKNETPVDEPTYSEVEKQAMESGWVPKDQWKGAEDDWTPAKAFIKYGQLEAEAKRERAAVSHKEKVIKSMKDHYLHVKEDAKKELLETFKRQKRDAIKNEDFATAAKIDEGIEELTENLDRKFTVRDKQVAETVQEVTGPPPEFYEWNQRNNWYRLGGQDEMSKEADALAIAFVQRKPDASYPEVLKHVTEKIQKLYPEKFEPPRKRGGDDINEANEVAGDAPRNTKVKLTAAEKEAASAFGMTFEEYAATLREFDKKKGYGQ